MPSGYKADGTPSNPTGKGFVPGATVAHGAQMAAGHALSKMMCKVLMEEGDDGKPRVEAMCRAIMRQAERGDVQSATWFADRILGKPAIAVSFPEPLNVAHSGEVSVSATDALIEAIIGFGEDGASTQSRPN